MDNFLIFILAVIGFGILVFFHELGHFIIAKIFKIKVEIFALGWGPALVKYKYKETIYQISMFPIGGFCKFKGDEMTLNQKELSRDPDSFYGVHPVKRLLVAFAGPFMNYIIAICFLTILALGSYKEYYLPAKIMLIDDFYKKFNIKNDKISPAKQGGLKTGDIIIKIDNKDIFSYEDISKYMFIKGKKEVNVTILRNNKIETFKINPEWDPYQLKAIIGVYYYIPAIIKYSENNRLIKYLELQDKDEIFALDDITSDITDIVVSQFFEKNYSSNKKSIIKIKRNNEIITKEIIFNELNEYISKKELNLNYYYPERIVQGKNIFLAFLEGFNKGNEIIMMSAIGLYSFIFKPKKNIQNQIGGPIRIGTFIGTITLEGFKESFYYGLRNFFSIISFISLALAFFNLLPFPAVDGGHIILNMYEIITRKSLSLKILYLINMIGFVIIIFLSIIVAYLDIFNLINR